MKKGRKLLLIYLIVQCFGNVTTVLATDIGAEISYNNGVERIETTQKNNAEMEGGSENEQLEKELPKGVGATIQDTFPDPNMAQAIANELRAEDVMTIITQEHISYKRYFSLSNQQISSIEGIQIFINLESLDISRNQLTSLPEDFGQLSNLVRLQLSENQLTALPESFGQLSRLIFLDLDNNQLTGLPDSIGQLLNLTYLSLDNNRLISLPESLSQLSKLVSLYISNSQLINLSESIGQLSNLTYLRLKNNQLISLPDSIGQLSNLNYLSLENNQLINLPANLLDLSNLVSLSLNANLLPTDTKQTLEALGIKLNVINIDSFNQLELGDQFSILTVQTESDITSSILAQYVSLASNTTVLSTHFFILEDYVDAGGNLVAFSDYFSHGMVIKTGGYLCKNPCNGHRITSK